MKIQILKFKKMNNILIQVKKSNFKILWLKSNMKLNNNHKKILKIFMKRLKNNVKSNTQKVSFQKMKEKRVINFQDHLYNKKLQKKLKRS